MDVSTALVAHPQPAELTQPAQGPLHHPAVHTQAAAVFRPAPGQRRCDVALSQRLAMPLGIIGSIPIQTRRPTTGTARGGRAPAARHPPEAAVGLRHGGGHLSELPTAGSHWRQSAGDAYSLACCGR